MSHTALPLTRIQTWLKNQTRQRRRSGTTIRMQRPMRPARANCCRAMRAIARFESCRIANHLGSGRAPEILKGVYRAYDLCSISKRLPKSMKFHKRWLCVDCIKCAFPDCTPSTRPTLIRFFAMLTFVVHSTGFCRVLLRPKAHSPSGEHKRLYTNPHPRVQYLVELMPFSTCASVRQSLQPKFLPSLAVVGSLSKHGWSCRDREHSSAVTRIRTWVVSATTRSTNHYTITANAPACP